MENKIQSFATFSETREAAINTKLKEEASTKRTSEAQRFADLLAEYEVTTVAEIAEEQRTEFFAKLIGETEEIENEGNAFGDAVRKAKENGEDEFEVDGKKFKVEAVGVNEAKVNPSGYVRAGKLGYNDQFLGRRSLSYTLSVDLGMNPDHEFSGGDWLGFDHVSMYVGGGKKEGTILADALKGKYTYAELKSAAADFLGIKESVGVDEGRAFAAAVNRAREAGEETFEFNGKEYKVTKKTKKINEEAIEIKEAEIKSDEDFMEYAMAIYKKAFGDDFDEAKAKEAAEGMLKKSDGDYGAAIGMLQSSIG